MEDSNDKVLDVVSISKDGTGDMAKRVIIALFAVSVMVVAELIKRDKED